MQPVSEAIVEDPDPSVLSTVLASSRASVSPTILDAMEEDLGVSVSSTVPAKQVHEHCAVSDWSVAECAMSQQCQLGQIAVVHVIGDPDSEVLSPSHRSRSGRKVLVMTVLSMRGKRMKLWEMCLCLTPCGTN